MSRQLSANYMKKKKKKKKSRVVHLPEEGTGNWELGTALRAFYDAFFPPGKLVNLWTRY